MTWPFAVTAVCGKLHAMSPRRVGETLADLAAALHVGEVDIRHAVELARRLRFPLDPYLVPLLDLPAG